MSDEPATLESSSICNCKTPTASLAHHAQHLASHTTHSVAPADSDAGRQRIRCPPGTLLLDAPMTPEPTTGSSTGSGLGARGSVLVSARRDARGHVHVITSARHGTHHTRPSARDCARGAAAAHRLLVRCVRRCACRKSREPTPISGVLCGAPARPWPVGTRGTRACRAWRLAGSLAHARTTGRYSR